jgi:hypothetical protein
MANDSVRRVDYWYAVVRDEPGTANDVLRRLASVGVDLMACVGFPLAGGMSQLDLLPSDPTGFEEAAEAAGIVVSPRKEALYIEGTARPGVLTHHLQKVASAGINCHATAAIAAPGGGYGFVLWVDDECLEAAEAALAGSTVVAT